MNKRLARRLIGRNLRLSPGPLSRTRTTRPTLIPERYNVWRMEDVKDDVFYLTNPQGYHLDLPAELAHSYTSPNILELRAQIIVQGPKLTPYPLRVYRWEAPQAPSLGRGRRAVPLNARPEPALSAPLFLCFALGLLVGMAATT